MNQGVTLDAKVIIVFGATLVITSVLSESPVKVIFPSTNTPAPAAAGVAEPLTVIPAVPPFNTDKLFKPAFTPPDKVTLAVVPGDKLAIVEPAAVKLNPLVNEAAVARLKFKVLFAETVTNPVPRDPLVVPSPICRVPEFIFVWPV